MKNSLLLALIFFAANLMAQVKVIKPDDSGINVSEKAEYKRVQGICENAVSDYMTKNNSKADEKSELMRQCITAGTVKGEKQTEGLKEVKNLDPLLDRKEDGLICKTKDGKKECESGSGGKNELYNSDRQIFKSPEVIKLGNYFEKQLKEALYGVTEEDEKAANKDPKKKKKKRIVDQKVFVDLYKSEVGKSIISLLTSYCIEANDNGVVPDEATSREQNKKNHLSDLKNFDPEPGLPQSAPTEGKKEVNAPKAARSFGQCIQNIKYICYEGKTISKIEVDPVTKKTEIKTATPDHLSKSEKDRACVVMNGLKKLRSTLTDLEVSEAQFKKLKDNYSTDGFNIAYGTSRVSTNEIDEKLEQTSDWVKKSGADEALKQRRDEVEKLCKEDPSNEECLKLSGDVAEEDFKKITEEYDARTNVEVAKIEKIESKEDLIKFYQESGLNEEEAKKRADEILALKNENFAEIRADINNQYQKDRDAVIAQLNKRFEEQVLSKKESGAQNDLVKEKEKTEKIMKELNTKSENYKQLIHYTNVVQAFLDVEDQEGNKKINSKTLNRELAHSGFEEVEYDAEGKPLTGTYTKENVDRLKQVIEAQKAQGNIPEDDSAAATLKKSELQLIIDLTPTPLPETDTNSP